MQKSFVMYGKPHGRAWWIATLYLGGLFLLGGWVGCSHTATMEREDSAAEDPLQRKDQAVPTSQTWDVYYLRDAKIGYGCTTVNTIVEDGRRQVHTNSENWMTLQRFGNTITQQLQYSTVETPEGRLVRFESKMTVGAVPNVVRGQFKDGKLHIETITAGKRQASRMAWEDGWGGFFAMEQTLRRKPMRPGEQRTIRALIPFFMQPADVRLEALQYESTKLLDGKRKLLKIKSTVDLGSGKKIESLVWVDRRGEALKTRDISMGQLSYRTTKQIALEKTNAAKFDLGEFSMVKVRRTLSRPHQSQRIAYRIYLHDRDPANVFVSGPTQSVQVIDEHTVEVVVRAIRPNRPTKLGPVKDKPTDEDLKPNNLIQSDDARIVSMAKRAAVDRKNPWQVATALERLVNESIHTKSFSQAFATAAEVAQHLEGDCTEHAVLLAALCRARKIPARVAIGLVYYPREDGYAYHMWNEVWIKDRWVPLDATLGRGGIGAAHLKLADSNLNGTSAYSSFLPVLQVIGRLQIEILEVQ